MEKVPEAQEAVIAFMADIQKAENLSTDERFLFTQVAGLLAGFAGLGAGMEEAPPSEGQGEQG